MKKVMILVSIIILLVLAVIIYIITLEPPPKKLIPDYINDPIVLKSKELIIMFGFSEEYFEEHFTLTDFSEFSLPNGAYVEWTFDIGNYQTTVHDGVGYSKKGDDYIHIHSLTPAANLELPVMSDFDVIPKSEADSLMSSCIGEFINERSELNLLGPQRGFFYIANPAEGDIFDCPSEGLATSGGPCTERVGIVDLKRGVIISCSE